jgi:hypothetical protein
MIVSDETFDKILAGSDVFHAFETEIHVASARVLLAMKLHATRHRHNAKSETDWADVINLIDPCGYAIDSEEFRKLVGKYAAPLSYERIRRQYLESRSPDSSA